MSENFSGDIQQEAEDAHLRDLGEAVGPEGSYVSDSESPAAAALAIRDALLQEHEYESIARNHSGNLTGEDRLSAVDIAHEDALTNRERRIIHFPAKFRGAGGAVRVVGRPVDAHTRGAEH